MGKVSAKKVPTAFLCVIILSTSSLAPAACNNSGTQRAAAHNEWAWSGGANTGGQAGMYGTLGGGAMGNIPGARQASVAWADASGNFWLFGGNGLDSAGSFLLLNDLWKYNSGQWTWMGGSNIGNQQGTYGSLGVPAMGNIPGARRDAVSWVDSSGNLWLFGGTGYDSAGTNGPLNDLWKYSAGAWALMGGSTQQVKAVSIAPQAFRHLTISLAVEFRLLVGLMQPETSGSSVGSAMIQLPPTDRSTTCGSTVREHGHGYPVPILSIRAVCTALRASQPLATFRGRGIRLLVGLIPGETFGSSVELDNPAFSMTCGGTVTVNGLGWRDPRCQMSQERTALKAYLRQVMSPERGRLL